VKIHHVKAMAAIADLNDAHNQLLHGSKNDDDSSIPLCTLLGTTSLLPLL